MCSVYIFQTHFHDKWRCQSNEKQNNRKSTYFKKEINQCMWEAPRNRWIVFLFCILFRNKKYLFIWSKEDFFESNFKQKYKITIITNQPSNIIKTKIFIFCWNKNERMRFLLHIWIWSNIISGFEFKLNRKLIINKVESNQESHKMYATLHI